MLAAIGETTREIGLLLCLSFKKTKQKKVFSFCLLRRCRVSATPDVALVVACANPFRTSAENDVIVGGIRQPKGKRDERVSNSGSKQASNTLQHCSKQQAVSHFCIPTF